MESILAPIIAKRRSLNKEISEQLLQKKELEARLTRLQTLANLGTLTAMIAHEINNILMPLSNYANVALSNPNDKALTEKALQKTVHNSARASEILDSIMAIVNGEAAEKRVCRFKQLVSEVFSCISRDFEKDCIKVVKEIPDDLDVSVVPVQMQQVMMNLIINAREAMLPRGGALTITARQENNSVIIEITDTGSGISAEDMEKIFQPFFTTKTPTSPAARAGAGLGLHFCKEIVESHDGTISVESNAGKGTKFSITLPK
ncbi:MAG: HAMP domain-containing histidine kinase [Planctomycetaceae bacterium]|nr:HAMP domain-containing histidine kinase [Planctomycetaceae bacterium]